MIVHADCLEALKKLEAGSVDSVVTDPPYGLGMFGWDAGLPDPGIWKECFRVLKPGGYILAFGSARLYHRLAADIEAAGFETHNMMAWLYSNGFPKGTDLSREFDRNDGVPVPDDAFRNYLREAIGRSPHRIKDLERMCGTGNMFTHYLGRSQPAFPTLKKWRILKKALKLDDRYDGLFQRMEELRKKFHSRKKGRDGTFFSGLTKDFKRHVPECELAKKWAGWRYGKACLRACMEPIYMGQKTPLRPIRENVVRHGTGALNIEGSKVEGSDGRVRYPGNVMHDGSEAVMEILDREGGNASVSLDQFSFMPKAKAAERRGNDHPTVKPLALMRHLVRLVTPEGGTCLDPFVGSGTTAVAAIMEGCGCIGMEKNKDYYEISRARTESLKLKEREAS